MRNFKIDTTLGVCPSKATLTKRASIFITRGTTSNITFDIKHKAYTFDQIEQLTFILKQPSGTMLTFTMYDTEGNMDPHFTHLVGTNYNYINYRFSPEESLMLELTSKNNFIEFEVAIEIDGDDADPMRPAYVSVEKQPLIGTIDSLYSKIIGD